MPEAALIIDVSREGAKLRISFSEKSAGAEGTLRPYEVFEPAWGQIEAACREILGVLNHANNEAKISDDNLQDLKKSGRLLYDLLVPSKAREAINATFAKHLVLYLDDQLVQIPWELLHNGREFLSRRFAVGRIVSTRQPLTSPASRDLKKPLKVLVLADPRGNLAAAYREGIEIRDFFDEQDGRFAVDLTSDPVDARFIKTNIRHYDIVHYAGHADFQKDNPSDSAWLLTDERLTAGDISALGGLDPMPSLVFANACQSGRSGLWQIHEGYEDQIFGLANAFLLAGVRHYIGTFWEILDQPSCSFAKSFYGFLAAGESVGEAVRRARRSLIERYGEETIVWASYMLYGDPRLSLIAQQPAVEPIESVTRFHYDDRGENLRGEAGVQPYGIHRRQSDPRVLFALFALAALLSVGYYHFATDRAPNATERSPTMLATGENLNLRVDIIGQRREANGSYSEVVVKEGGVLHSGDQFQVHLQSNRPSHVYVLLFGSDGRASQLFPAPKFEQPGYTEGNKKFVIPDRDLWFWLDDNPGTETIYVLASERPMTDLRGLLLKMEKVNQAEMEGMSGTSVKPTRIVERGVGGVAQGKAALYSSNYDNLIRKVTEVVTGSGAMVRAISFHHR